MDTSSDWIRAFLAETKNSSWGFVMYRCTYRDDEQWETFMKTMSGRLQRSLERQGGQDLLKEWDWSVQQDSAFEGTSKADVRKHFEEWVKQNYRPGGSPRYRLCLMADQDSVESVLAAEKTPREDRDYGGFIYMVKRGFNPEASASDDEYDDSLNIGPDEEDSDEDRSGAETDEDEDSGEISAADDEDEYEPLEGLTKEEVGWIKLDADSNFPGTFSLMYNDNFDEFYYRPPRIVRPM